MARPSLRRRGQLWAVAAALAWSTAGLFQREISAGEFTQMAGRALFGAAAILVYLAVTERDGLVAAFRSIGRGGLGVGFCIGVASAAFVLALNHTTVAQVLLFQALAPVIAALLGMLFLGERIGIRTWLAMALAISGVTLMVGASDDRSLVGSGAAAVMALGFAATIVLSRRHRGISMAPAICLGQLLVLVAALAVLAAQGFHEATATSADVMWLFLLGVIQVGIGFGAFTVAARLVPAAELALITLLEVVLGPLWVWVSTAETPAAVTILGGAIVLAGVALEALSGRPGKHLEVPPAR